MVEVIDSHEILYNNRNEFGASKANWGPGPSAPKGQNPPHKPVVTVGQNFRNKNLIVRRSIQGGTRSR